MSAELGTVIGVHRGECEVVHGDRVVPLKLIGRQAHRSQELAVGDEVRFDAERGVVLDVEPRRTRLARRRPRARHREHVIAANVDQLAIVTAVAEPPFRSGAVDRFMLAAFAGGLRPILVVNKIDLLDGAPLPDEIAAYASLLPLFPVCAVAPPRGLAELREALAGARTVFAGHSGVGKSSVLNALEPDLRLETGDVARHGRGRHTAAVGEPDGVGEVVQRDEGLDPARARRPHHVAVVRQRALVEAPRLGLDATPLDGEARRTVAELARQLEVRLVELPLPTRLPRGVGHPPGQLRAPPVVADVPPLDLMGRRRRAPVEPLGKSHGRRKLAVGRPAGNGVRKGCPATRRGRGQPRHARFSWSTARPTAATGNVVSPRTRSSAPERARRGAARARPARGRGSASRRARAWRGPRER